MLEMLEMPKTESLTRSQVVECLSEFRASGDQEMLAEYNQTKDAETFKKFIQTCNVEWRNKVVEANMGLVLMVSKKYFASMGDEDAASEGFLGLIKAAEKFDETQGTEFSTFAVKCIKTHLNRKQEESNTRSSHNQWHSREFKRVEGLLRNQLGRAPDIFEIHQGLECHIGRSKPMKSQHWTLEKTKSIQKAIQTGNFISLSPGKDDDEGKIDFLGCSIDDDVLEMDQLKEDVNKALGTLTERERFVIHSRLFEVEPMTLEEVGAKLGVTRERIRQIEATAMEKLKNKLRARHAPEKKNAFVR